MTRHTVPAAVSLGIALALAPSARAQSTLPGAAAIAAAHHAADATDAHTAAMTSPTALASAAPRAAVPNANRYGAPDETRGESSSRPASASQSRVTAPAARPAAKGAPMRADSTPAAPIKAGKNVMSFSRETYSYAGGGRRDPFKSLLAAGGDLRPLMSDLRLVTIVYGTNGQNSVAILRDLTTKEQYRVHVGQTLGRMRVSAIEPRQVVFTIEEFGFSRQETLMYNDPNTMRSK